MVSRVLQLTLESVLAAVATAQNATLCEGIKTIRSQADADAIGAACSTFTGNVVLADGPLYSTVTLDGMKEITGDLTAHDWMMIRIPSLERIGGVLKNQNSYTVTVELPKLTYVGAGILFTETDAMRPGLQYLRMPSLVEVNGSFIVTGYHYFSELQIPSLERINGLFKIADEFGLFDLSADKLESVGPGGIDLAGNFWRGISLASIQSVHPTFKVVAYSAGNCTEFNALRQPGGPLAASEQ